MEDKREYDKDRELANHILSILKTAPVIVGSWGINPKTIKVIENGMEFHVRGFKHTGKVHVLLNYGKDLFEVCLISKTGEILKMREDVYIEDLIFVIDELVEKTDDYEKRISEEYGFLGE